ncbi:MAG TPA: twin-arginine translocation pathway signal protein, partial [Candidatus Binatia bacterium]
LQAFATVLMFMDDSALNFFDRSGGWEFGAAPSIVVLDKGLAGSITTTTMQKGVFAFILNQQGVMAGIGLEGTKITRIIPGP